MNNNAYLLKKTWEIQKGKMGEITSFIKKLTIG